MSQYPPPGQPPMQPPYGGAPAQMPYGMPAPAPKTSVAAIASLICGILGCVPFATSLAAIILGFVGIKSTSGGRANGRVMAIIGLILGLIGIVAWTGIIGAGFWGVGKLKTLARDQAQPFVQAVMAGDYDKAANYTHLSEDEMKTLHDQMQGWGTMSDMSVTGFNAQKDAGTPGQTVLTGHANFSSAGEKDFEVVMDSRDGKLKVTGIHFK